MYGNRQPLAGGPQCRLPRCRGPDRPPGRLGAHRGLRRTTEATGIDGVLGTWGWLVVLLASLLVGLQVAVEPAALQLGVVEALGRGSPRIALVRYVALTASVVVALWALVSTFDLDRRFGPGRRDRCRRSAAGRADRARGVRRARPERSGVSHRIRRRNVDADRTRPRSPSSGSNARTWRFGGGSSVSEADSPRRAGGPSRNFPVEFWSM